MILLLKSIVLGIVIAAPVGPMCILCINRTLNYSLIAGVLTGLGIATADAIYCCIAGFGITFISSFLLSHQCIIKIAGGLLLCYLGFNTLIKTKAGAPIKDNKKTLIGDYLSSFALTITNPMTILVFIAIFASLREAYSGYSHAITVVIGVFLGSLLWWLFICSAVKAIHKKINAKIMQWINYASGLIVIAFGLMAIAH
jgi:threonine/homoserine/homoserine lactone efflux protein